VFDKNVTLFFFNPLVSIINNAIMINKTLFLHQKHLHRLCLIVCSWGILQVGFGQAALNTDGSAPDSKAMLDIKSTDKGLLIPRMTTAQRTGITGLSATQKGLLVYDMTTNSVWQFNGTDWVEIGAAATPSVWTTKNDSTIYTTKKQVGINTDDPRAALHTVGGGLIIQGKQKLPFNAAANTYDLPASGSVTNTSPTPDSMGIIRSHSGAGTTTYSANVNGTLAILPKSGTSPIGVRLTFTHFNTEATNDTVVIKDLYNDHIKNVVFSGSSLPAVFYYSTPYIFSGFRVKFQTNASTNSTGFIFKYEFIYEDNTNASVIGKTVGTGLMYDITKNALLTGDLSKSSAQIGDYSTALGSSTASGFGSTASGFGSTASGFGSTAFGEYSTAFGNYSTAFGKSMASGYGSTASGISFASGEYSTASGNNCVASSHASTALGGGSTASGGGSIALGIVSTATGDVSMATGFFTWAKAYASTAIGSFNDSIASSSKTTWVSTDPLFIVGNGTSDAARSNALVVLKNGNIGVNNVNTPLHPITFPDALGPKISLYGNVASHYGFGIDNGTLQMYTDYLGTNISIGLRDAGGTFVQAAHINTVTGLYTQTSDRRYKRDFTPLSNPLDKILKISGLHYYWDGDRGTRDSSRQSGVIAQEVQAVMPELVRTDEKGFLSVNYAGFAPYLIESIKILKKENEDLRQQVAALSALKADVEALKAMLQTATTGTVPPSVNKVSERK
jgi:Chaperone of endosialidase/Head domain of trimeric autotransporter adhesin